MSYSVNLTASIVAQNLALPAGENLEAQAEKVDIQVHDEFIELDFILPPTPVDSTYSQAKVLNLAGFTIDPETIYIKTDKPIFVIQPPGTFLQPVRSLFAGTYTKGTNDPDSLKFVNLNVTEARVKVILGSKN